jgi:RHS repeat-associated protein
LLGHAFQHEIDHLDGVLFIDRVDPDQLRRLEPEREEAGVGLYYYNARWYDPVLGTFIQADRMVLELGSYASGSQYQYVLGNPIRLADPTGHWADMGCSGRPAGDCGPANTVVESSNASDNSNGQQSQHVSPPLCELAPQLCRGGRLNPLNYETIGVSGKGALKFFGGVELNISLYVDPDGILYLDPSKSEDFGLFLDLDFSAGISTPSAFSAIGISVTGTDGGVLDQTGVSVPNANASGCLLGGCLGVGASYDVSGGRFDSVEWFGGVGEGLDVSGGASYSDFVVYGNKQGLFLKAPLPIAPAAFFPWR